MMYSRLFSAKTARQALVGASLLITSIFAVQQSLSQSQDGKLASVTDAKQLLLAGYQTGVSTLENIRLVVREELKTDPEWQRQLSVDKAVAGGSVDKDTAAGVAKNLTVSAFRPDFYYTRQFEKERIGPPGGESPPAFETADGSRHLTYYSTENTNDSLSKVGHVTISKQSDNLFEGESGLGALIGSIYRMTPKNVLNSPQSAISTTPERMNDLLAYKVSAQIEVNGANYSLAYWLAPERSGLPLRMEIRDGNSLVRLLEWTSFSQLPSGLWFPHEVVRHNFIGAGDQSVEVSTSRLVVKSVEIDPKVNEIDFSTDPRSAPAGAYVNDTILNLRYVSNEGPVSDERIQKVLSKSLSEIGLESHPTSTSPAASSRRPLLGESGIYTPMKSSRQTAVFYWIWPVGGVALLGILLVLAGVKYARRHAGRIH